VEVLLFIRMLMGLPPTVDALLFIRMLVGRPPAVV